MVTLYSYPSLFGVADNNGYGLKVFAFMRLVGIAFVHEHIFDASAARRWTRASATSASSSRACSMISTG